MTAALRGGAQDAAQAYLDMLGGRPKLRGLLHGIAFPLAVAAGIVLVSPGRHDRARLGCAIYALSACLLFGVSALYHRWHGSQRVRAVLRRLDHANIFLIIAGTYSPIALIVLRGSTSAGRADGGLGRRAARHRAAAAVGQRAALALRPIYLALGWVAVFVIPDLLHRGGVAVLVLVAVGGALYSLGAVVYAFKRPDPVPRVFGFHEVFHALTVAAFVLQYVAVSIATYSLA